MGLFPVIQQDCPYKDNLSAILEGDFCRLCKRTVHDLDGLSEVERIALIEGCEGRICVRYSAALPAAAALALTVAGGAIMAAAAAPGKRHDSPGTDHHLRAAASPTQVTVGIIAMPAQARWVEIDQDRSTPAPAPATPASSPPRPSPGATAGP